VDLAPGTLLLGKYRIDGQIGTGGMGHVVRASHLYLHQPVAIKLLLPEMTASHSTVQRFLREAQATVKLRSEHSARVMDVGTTDEGVPFMVMEFLDGNDLNQILRHHGPQQPAIVVDLLLQACEGIAEAHALGIVHRDIKPSNFFITRRPDGSMLLKILDFGISKTPIGYEELTGTQTVIGTPSYMAPEQMKSGRDADPRSDIWSLGVVMYQLLSGRLPFSGESYAELVLKVGLEPPAPIPVPLPAGLGDVIMRCLEKDPGQRYQHVGELARMLAPYATDPITASQSAARTLRTLQQRSSLQGMHGSPLTAGGGLATPIPISPAQLTPRSWPPSQGTSVSRGAGQVTYQTRSARARLIAGVASLCVAAGGGGYAISQLSRGSDGPREPHVLMPPRSEPAAAAPASGSAATAPADPAAPPTAPPTAPPAAAPAPAPSPAAAAPTAAGMPTAPDAPPTWHPTTPPKTLTADHPADAHADPKPAGVAPTDGKPASQRAVDSKQPAVRSPDAKPPTKPADAKSTRSKPKPADDLFGKRI
jgi:eukaryotic-like serine/threonine-protein kinase